MREKSCLLICNKFASGFKEKKLKSIANIIWKTGYEVNIVESKYSGFIEDKIAYYSNIYDIILTMGGDGTVREAYRGLSILDYLPKAAYGHIPGGTTNDEGPNSYINRYNPLLATKKLLGQDNKIITEERKILTINDEAIAYVSAIGVLAPITYLIDKSEDKKDAGTFSYIRYGAGQIFKNKNLWSNIVKNPFKITYTYNDGGLKTKQTEVILIVIFKGISFANLQINPMANMCDNKFEVILVKNPSELFKLLSKSFNPFNKDIVTLSTDYFRLNFDDKTPYYPINCDGDSFDLLKGGNILEAKTKGTVKRLVGLRKY